MHLSIFALWLRHLKKGRVMKKFTVLVEMYEGLWSEVHVLEANNLEEANKMVRRWRSYHQKPLSEAKAVEAYGVSLNWEVADWWKRFK